MDGASLSDCFDLCEQRAKSAVLDNLQGTQGDFDCTH
jgi:hypothetical protein